MSGVRIDIDRAEIDALSQTLITNVLTHAKRAVAAQTRGLEKDIEALTRQNVPGNLWRGWKSAVHPRGNRLAYEPTGTVFVNGGARSRGAMAYWTEPGVNKARSGFWLAVPTEAAGPRGRSRDLTPGEWERRNGMRLHFVYQGGGKPALLVARQVLAGANGKGVRATTGRRLQNARYQGAKTQDVVIFFLIPFQRFANKFSVAPAIERRGKMLIEDFESRMAKVNKST
ncbi:MAG: hypothetical protein KA533_07480 [Sphingobium sp.]|nr:hypothetical protein [Sphingobium sp.]MBP6112582.1 hypothetical protein [Sphingobium sp.]MBP8671624.1 hypothetical protein [Sphingobium sp.]MBP9158612.1 hypothetical protein [Sphingobium sp.]